MSIHYGHSLDLPECVEWWVLLSKEETTVKLSETERLRVLHLHVCLCEHFTGLHPNCV